MKTADLSLIKQFEGLRLVAYQDVIGVWTIGYGTTRYPNGIKVKKGDVITKAQAEDYLRNDVRKFELELDNLLQVKLKQNQYDALISFVYNLGSKNLSSSTLLKRINKNPLDPNIGVSWKQWINAGGKPVNGLKIRREKEYELYAK